MYGIDNFSSWLLISSKPEDFLFSSFDMYLPSSETERYGMTNGSCPPVFCFQKSCKRFEHSYTFVEREREGETETDRQTDRLFSLDDSTLIAGREYFSDCVQ